MICRSLVLLPSPESRLASDPDSRQYIIYICCHIHISISSTSRVLVHVRVRQLSIS